MGRWRAPERAGSKYITPAGAARLRAELDQLWRVERPQVTQSVSEAAAQGDRSENAEYTYGKKRLREIDRRVRFLRQRLDGVVIVAAAADRSAARVLRCLGRARRHTPANGASTASSARTNSTWTRATSAWIRRSAGCCWARRSTPRSRSTLPAGEQALTIVAIRYEAPAA